MKKIHIAIVIPLILFTFIIGVVLGFSLGVASSDAGSSFLKSLVKDEEKANTTSPVTLKRAHFLLRYPRNWKIDKEDKDYDPDHMFSIDSPGNSYVMFIMGPAETDPEQNIQQHLTAFKKIFGETDISRFERYGDYRGKGITMQGKILGISTKVRIFSCYVNDRTTIIVEQYPIDDSALVSDGLKLIESSFQLR